MTSSLPRTALAAGRRPVLDFATRHGPRALRSWWSRLAAPAALAVAVAGASGAATLRVANQGDALSMDPHSLAEAVQLAFLGNVFEPLVSNDRTLEPIPALATKWFLTSPTVWRFELRRGVKFRDDRPFTADDVVFSLERARGEGSDVKGKNPFKFRWATVR